LSIIHVFETISRADEKSRQRLVDIMIKISNNYSIKSFLDTHIKDNDSLKNIILNRYDEEFVNGIRNNDKIMKNSMLKDRDSLLELSKSNRYPNFLFRRFFGLVKFLNIELKSLCKDKIISKSMLDNKEKIFKFLEEAPSLNISTKLTYSLLKDKERPIQEHDNRDINFLSTAIPYCDIVITERTWKHLARINKLDSEYLTIIENDLNYLLTLS